MRNQLVLIASSGNGPKADRMRLNKILRLRNIHIRQVIIISVGMLKVVMRSLIMVHQEEGFGFITLFLKPFQCLVSNRIRGMFPGKRDQILRPGFVAANTKFRIVKLTLPGQYAVIIKICGLLLKVPLADHRSLVTRLLHFTGQMLATAFNSSTQIMHSTGMGILTGDNSRPTGCTDRVGTKSVLKKNPLLGQSVNCWCRIQFGQTTSIGSNSLRGMVIRHNKKNIRPGFSNGELSNQ